MALGAAVWRRIGGRRKNELRVASDSRDSRVSLIRAYLDAVSLSESLQTRLWHEAELTLVQIRVLRRLAKQAQTMGQIGAELALRPASVTQLIDRLDERGLIHRSRGDADRRQVFANLTDKGRRLVRKTPLIDGTAIGRAVEQMAVADRERIAAAINEFIVAVRSAEDKLQQHETQP